jgi:hypothetical protein
MAIALRHSRLIPSGGSFVAYLAAAMDFLDGLLEGEYDGFAIDATSATSVAAAYVGGPVGGDVLVGEDGVPSLDHVPLDASNLTQSGTSPKTVHWNSAPYVRWSPHNLSFDSEVFNNWSNIFHVTATDNNAVAPDGTTTGSLWTVSITGESFIGDNIALAANTYTVSVYAKAGTTSWIAVGMAAFDGKFAYKFYNISAGTVGASSISWAGGSVVSGSIEDAGGGWWRCQTTVVTANAGGPIIYLAEADNDIIWPGTGSTAYLWGAQTNRGYIATPYIKNTTAAARIGIPQAYDPYEDCFGILIEPAATNLQIRSESIDGGVGDWTEQNLTAAINAVAPDGSTTATTLTASSGSAVHNIYESGGVATTANTTYTISIYAKQGTARYIQFNNGANVNEVFGAIFDLQSAAITDTFAGSGGTYSSGTITAIGNGWFRISVTGQTTTTNTSIAVHISDAATQTQGNYGDFSWTAAGTETMLVWGAQVELGTVATSYIPTLGSTVTRAVDDLAGVSVSSFPYSATKSTLYADFKVLVESANELVWNLWADATNSLELQLENSNIVRLRSGIDMQCDSVATISVDTRHQVTAAVAANDADMSFDGAAVVSDASVTMPTAATGLYFGKYASGSNRMYGYIYRFVYIPRQLQTEG